MNTMNTKIQSAKELFDKGVKHISDFLTDGDSGVTGLDNPFGMEIIKEINNYMYTTYSTNRGDRNLTIEGVLPHSLFNRIKSDLRDKGYWFIAQNPLASIKPEELATSSKELIGSRPVLYSHLGNNRNKTRLERIIIDGKDLNIFYPDVWKVDEYLSNNKIIISRQEPLFFMNDECMKEIMEPGIGNEVLDYTDKQLFMGDDPLIGLFIEDPDFSKKDLYEQLLKILKKNLEKK